MATSGQTLNDRINAARYALAGQGLARCVCKATTEEVIGPKKKHLDYLLACTHEPNVSIPQLANLLIERTNHIYWVVVFKALVTVHHLMSYANERFIQYLASSNYSFELSTFLDKTAARDFSMSTFIRRYSRYINEKALSYRLLAFDFCKVKRGNEGVLRLMPIDKLLKTLPILQNQLDALLEFDCGANDLNNGVINACFMLLFRDMIGLYACHNDGIINLLNKYFSLNRKMCKEALDLYKKFLVRVDKISDFLRVAEVVGIDKDEIPDVRRAPGSFIDALEQHLQNLESNKKTPKQSQTNTIRPDFSTLGGLTPPSSRRSNSPNTIASSSLSSAATPASNSTSAQNEESTTSNFKDDEVRKALEEEARMLSQYGGDGLAKSNKSVTSKSSAAESLSTSRGGSPKFAVTTIPKTIDDLLGDSDAYSTNNNNGELKTNGNTKPAENNGKSAAFDNLSLASSTTSNTAPKYRHDLDSIKLTIKSATTTLEKSNSSTRTASSEPTKKASDELLSLFDSPNLETSAPQVPTDEQQAFGPFTTTAGFNEVSPFAPTSFDLSTTNGRAPAFKPGNPFPSVSSDFAASSIASAFSANPIKPVSSQPGVPNPGLATANYTNLGTLDGFGELLQPTSTASKNSNIGQNHANKSPFASGVASTGLFKGDLESTLANLAQNLTIDGIKTKK